MIERNAFVTRAVGRWPVLRRRDARVRTAAQKIPPGGSHQAGLLWPSHRGAVVRTDPAPCRSN